MRLTVFRFEQWPTEPSVLADLAKIYDGETLAELARQVAAGQVLLTAHFNDHELAACLLSASGNERQLSALAVREVTRRRGVGAFLVGEAAAMAAAAGANGLQLNGVEDDAAAAFAAACGFIDEGYRLPLTSAVMKDSSSSSP